MLGFYNSIQYLHIFDNEDDFRSRVRKDDHTFVTSMLRVDEFYIAVKTLGLEWDNLGTISIWHPEKIKNLGKDGHFVIGLLSSQNKSWKVYLATNTGITGQEIAVFDNWEDLKQYISKQWSRGMDVTDLYNHKGRYYIVTSSGLNWNQSYCLGLFPEKNILQASEDGRFITEIMKIGDKYLWIFSGNTGYKKQTFMFASGTNEIATLNEQLLSDNGYNGYRLTLIRRITNKFFFVLLK